MHHPAIGFSNLELIRTIVSISYVILMFGTAQNFVAYKGLSASHGYLTAAMLKVLCSAAYCGKRVLNHNFLH